MDEEEEVVLTCSMDAAKEEDHYACFKCVRGEQHLYNPDGDSPLGTTELWSQ